MAEQTVDAHVTMYGWPDNDPPGAGIAYPKLHQQAGGEGSFEDPITFASDSRDLAPGTKIYVPYLQKYFVMEDYCADAVASRTDPLHVDLWAGGSASVDVAKLLAVENANTRDSAQIIVNAEAGHPVDLTPFDGGPIPASSAPTAPIANNPVSTPAPETSPAEALVSANSGTQDSGVQVENSPFTDDGQASDGQLVGGSVSGLPASAETHQPTAVEQYMLQLVNSERAKAGVQPLAFNGQLNAAADGHNATMIETGQFSHVESNGSDPAARIEAAGYTLIGQWTNGENIAWTTTSAPAGIADETLALHQNLMESPGHKANILNADFSEVGLGVQQGDFQGYDSAVTTQNFAHSGSSLYLTGAAFADNNGNLLYDPGEGLAGIEIKATDATGQAISTTTMEAGGYRIALASGEYDVSVSGAGITASTHHVAVGTQNVGLNLAQSASGQVAGTEATMTPTASTDTPQSAFSTGAVPQPATPADTTASPPVANQANVAEPSTTTQAGSHAGSGQPAVDLASFLSADKGLDFARIAGSYGPNHLSSTAQASSGEILTRQHAATKDDGSDAWSATEAGFGHSGHGSDGFVEGQEVQGTRMGNHDLGWWHCA